MAARAVTTFEDLYRRDRVPVVALAYALTGSRTAAEELSQEAFLAAYRSWARIGGYDDPGAWVRRVVANRAVSRWRRTAAEARALTRVGTRRELPAELPEASAEFWRAVRALPPRQAQVVALHYVEDRSVADIAAVLGTAEGTIKAHLFKARAALAETLGEDS
jgi:RNA polymerase sigma-70 factor (ECF subfamily)